MKSFKQAVGKVFLYASFVICVIAMITFMVLFALRDVELSNLKQTFEQARMELNEDNQDKQVTIQDLRTEYLRLNAEIKKLNDENNSLKKTISDNQKEGNGVITGKLANIALVQSGKGVSQVQEICATNVQNKNLKYCRTALALDGSYSLVAPSGKYTVSASIYPETNETKTLQGKYTEYVVCSVEKGAEKCNPEKQNAVVEVTLEAGKTLSNISPIDWTN